MKSYRFAISTMTLVVVIVLGSSSLFAADEMPTDVKIQTSSHGPIYVTAEGRTLYTRSADKPGESQCLNEKQPTAQCCGGYYYLVPMLEKQKTCAEKWPPFQPTATAKPVGKWTVLTRKDGVQQWAYDSKPLYTSARDVRPGQITEKIDLGTSVVNYEISVLPATSNIPIGIAAIQTPRGVIFTVGKKALYTIPSGGRSWGAVCDKACQDQWVPVPAPFAADAIGEWSAVKRDDGTSQWAYRRQPVFTFAGDSEANEINGERIRGARVVEIMKFPDPPAGILITKLPFGDAYMTARGQTLYALYCEETTPANLSCDEPGDADAYVMASCGGLSGDCSKIFVPFLAAENAKPVDPFWSIQIVDQRNPVRPVKAGDGVRVWAYRGHLLYTYVGDKEPGDWNGEGYGDRSAQWSAILLPGTSPRL